MKIQERPGEVGLVAKGDIPASRNPVLGAAIQQERQAVSRERSTEASASEEVVHPFALDEIGGRAWTVETIANSACGHGTPPRRSPDSDAGGEPARTGLNGQPAGVLFVGPAGSDL